MAGRRSLLERSSRHLQNEGASAIQQIELERAGSKPTSTQEEELAFVGNLGQAKLVTDQLSDPDNLKITLEAWRISQNKSYLFRPTVCQPWPGQFCR